jgi:hypothetical protein
MSNRSWSVLQTPKAVIGEAGAVSSEGVRSEIPSKGFGPQPLRADTRVEVPQGSCNLAGVGSSCFGDEQDRGGNTPRGPRANPGAANSSTMNGAKALASQTGRRGEAEPRNGSEGWVRGCFSLRSPEIGSRDASGNYARSGERDIPSESWNQIPSDVTGRSTLMTNLGSTRVAGVVLRCLGYVHQVLQTHKSGSGGRVGASGSWVNSGQGSPGFIGVFRVVPNTGSCSLCHCELTTKALTGELGFDVPTDLDPCGSGILVG